jgi:hypothetical protein
MQSGLFFFYYVYIRSKPPRAPRVLVTLFRTVLASIPPFFHKMKRTQLLIALAIALTGWSTKGNVPLDYTKGLVGTYFMTYMNWNSEIVVMPEPGFSGSIRMKKVDFTHLEMIFSVKVKGPKETFSQASDPKQIELKPNSGQWFTLYDGLEKIGTISPTTIVIKTTTETGAGMVDIKARR